MQQTVDFDRQVVLVEALLEGDRPIRVADCRRPQDSVGGADLWLLCRMAN